MPMGQVCMCVCVFRHARVQACMGVQMCMHAGMHCVQKCTCADMHGCVQMCTCAGMHVFRRTSVWAGMCVQMCTCARHACVYSGVHVCRQACVCSDVHTCRYARVFRRECVQACMCVFKRPLVQAGTYVFKCVCEQACMWALPLWAFLHWGDRDRKRAAV